MTATAIPALLRAGATAVAAGRVALAVRPDRYGALGATAAARLGG